MPKRDGILYTYIDWHDGVAGPHAQVWFPEFPLGTGFFLPIRLFYMLIDEKLAMQSKLCENPIDICFLAT